MKKITFSIPFLIFISILNFPLSSLEAAGCSSHKKQNIQEKCIKNNEFCEKTKSMKKQNKVDI